MKIWISSCIIRLIFSITFLLLSGCINSAVIETHELSMPVLKKNADIETGGSKSSLPLVSLRLGAGRLTAEVASTPEQYSRGLAFRSILKADDAMLFAYQTPHKVVFYMKDTLLPLSLAYIDSMGIVLEIYGLEPGVETPVIAKSAGVRFALEVNRGWFEKNGIVPGIQIYIEKKKQGQR
jgi:uncharacterized membrane protein (UPF0127 family)